MLFVSQRMKMDYKLYEWMMCVLMVHTPAAVRLLLQCSYIKPNNE